MNHWTPADQAELDVLVLAWVEGFWSHRERCYVCWAGGRLCRWAGLALQEILDWQERRAITSRAIGYRARLLADYRLAITEST